MMIICWFKRDGVKEVGGTVFVATGGLKFLFEGF